MALSRAAGTTACTAGTRAPVCSAIIVTTASCCTRWTGRTDRLCSSTSRTRIVRTTRASRSTSRSSRSRYTTAISFPSDEPRYDRRPACSVSSRRSSTTNPPAARSSCSETAPGRRRGEPNATSATLPTTLPSTTVTTTLTGVSVALMKRTTTATATASHDVRLHASGINGEAVAAPATSAARYADDGKSVGRNDAESRPVTGTGGAARASQSVSSAMTTPPTMPAPTTSAVSSHERRRMSQAITASGMATIVSWARPMRA